MCSEGIKFHIRVHLALRNQKTKLAIMQIRQKCERVSQAPTEDRCINGCLEFIESIKIKWRGRTTALNTIMSEKKL